ncbi:MAG: ABC transporter permease [Rhodobacter sp.]|jgi:ribose transport system permease protein|nr:ABC transporter permease [Rhodobacter sp.]
MTRIPKTVAAQRSGPLSGLTRFPEVSLILMILVASTVFTFISPAFASLGNVESLLRAIAFVGIIVIGQAILLIVGELDLSVGSVAGMAAIVAGLLMSSVGLPIPLAMLIAVACGACCGLINGVLTTKAGIPAFVVTLSMLFVAKGIGYVLSGGDPVYPLPEGVTLLAKTDILGLPSSVWILLILVLMFDQFMRRASWGRIAYATGGNARTSRFAGIDTDRVKIAAFVLTGALAAFAGVLLTSRLGRADASIGLGWELIVLAAAVVGGIRLNGGAGTIAGAFLGLLFLQVVQTGLVFAGVDALMQPVVSGSVLVLAVAYDMFRRKT